MIILIVLAVIAALLCHLLMKSYWLAVSISVSLSVFLFWVIASSHFGWFDAVFYKNLAIAVAASSAISMIIGGALKKLHGNESKGQPISRPQMDKGDADGQRGRNPL